MTNEIYIDGQGPIAVQQPSHIAALKALVKDCSTTKTAIYPLGGRTHLHIGRPPFRPGTAIDLRSLNKILDYPARDMTITVQAGLTLKELQDTLRKEYQRLPIDVPRCHEATLGGCLACNVSGPRRYAKGTLRDYVIGISCINDRGEEFKAGGKVVKNVAGYDLCKLMIGSLGTLGIISQITLKLHPLPEQTALIAIPCSSDKLPDLLHSIHESRTRPVAIELLNRQAVRRINQQMESVLPDSLWLILVGFEGNRAAVSWQIKQLIQEIPDKHFPGLDVRMGDICTALWHGLIERGNEPEAQLCFKANLLADGIAAFCTHASLQEEDLAVHAHAGNGIIRIQSTVLPELNRVKHWLQTWQSELGKKSNLIIERCPIDWKTVVPIWGNPPSDVRLMRRIKQAFDPEGIFNPGRFVEGLEKA